MTELAAEVLDVRAQEHAAAPHLLFRLRLTESTGARVHAIALRAQLRIEPQRRPYDDAERAGLADLFGTPDRYADTLKPFLWTHASTMVQGFHGETEVELPVACTYDFDVSGTKYLHALGDDGEVPLLLLFSGTVFTRGETGFAAEQLLVVARGPVPAAGGHLAPAHGPLLPRRRLDPAGPRQHRRSRPAPVGAGPHVLGGDGRRPPPCSGGRGAAP